jgi:hypothetical protein
MMGGYGYGPMRQYMLDALAEALNLTPEQLQTHLNQGETPWQIAQSQGLSADQFRQAMLKAQDEALDEAVKAGVLTQQQADWMDQHMESMWSGGFGCFGGVPGSGPKDAPNGSNNSNRGNFQGPMMRSY